MIRLEIEFVKPSYAVLTMTSTLAEKYSLKKIGKNPATTVVIYAEFAQS